MSAESSTLPEQQDGRSVDELLDLVDLLWMAFGCRQQPPS